MSADHEREAEALIRRKCEELGVPYDQVRSILNWHSQKAEDHVENLATLPEKLEKIDRLISEYNCEMVLQQLRRRRQPARIPALR